MTSRELVLYLLRKLFKGDVGPQSLSDVSSEIWEEALALATGQGVLALCFEAIEQFPANQRPPLELLMQWYGQTEQQKEQYEQMWDVACKLNKLWAAEGIQATVLKGRSIAQYYPVPSHRYSCDLDIFIEHDWERACELLEKKGVLLEREVYKEVEFTLDGVYVECHRYITPVRGNKHLQKVERYLRALLRCEPKTCFEGTTLACPPLMFNAILFVEHALGDFLHGTLLLKHIVDWIVLRKQNVAWDTFHLHCKEFGFSRFLTLIESFADVVEGKIAYESLSPSCQRLFDEIIHLSAKPKSNHSWFHRRVNQFFNTMKSRKKFHDFGYISMPQFLFNTTWAHFFDKEVRM